MKKSVHTPEYACLRELLRKVRGDAQLSQRDLAAKLDVSPSWVAKVESGERRIDVVEFYWLVAACGADPATSFLGLCGQFSKRRKADRSKGASAS